MNRIPILAALALLSLPAHSQLYKWVDSQGKVHYSDTPPPAGAQKSKTIQAPSPAPAAPAAASGSGGRSIAEQELEFKKRQVEAAQQQAKADEEAKLKRANCDRAQSNLRTFQEGGRVFNYDAKGERQYIDDAARGAELKKWEQEVSKWCG